MLHATTRLCAWGFVICACFGVAGAVRAQELPCNTHGVSKVVPADAIAGQQFGDAVALSGATLVIGAPLRPSVRPDVSGVVYVYAGSEGLPQSSGHRSLRFDLQVTLLPPDLVLGGRFGDCVALAGDVLVVGASDTTDIAQGAACVYRYDGSAWAPEATLVAANGGPGERFGVAVAVGPDVVVVGAPQAGAGAAYVFRRTGAVWAQEARLTAAAGAAGDHFGGSVATSGDAILVGAPDVDDVGADSGAAYLFRHSGGDWGQELKLVAANGAAGDRFGLAVALAGDVALIGAPAHMEAGAAGVGYVYRRRGADWLEEGRLSLEASDRFRHISVVLAEDLALVGANGSGQVDDTDGQAWVWRFNGTAWERYAWLYGTAGSGSADASLGSAVALSGEVAVVGARLAEVKCGAENCSAGAVYAYRGLADCDGNGVLDVCEIYHDAKADCNDNELPDECDIASGTSHDCDGDGVPDECTLGRGIGVDCNGNWAFDECDIADGTSVDCNSNGVPDECDLASEASQDCNGNGVPDECDIAAGTSQDTKLPGIPDECVSDACPMACRLSETNQVTDPETSEFVGGFGAPLALSGSVLAVAAPTYGHDAGGRVYIYRQAQGAWAWEFTLRGGEERLGTAIALDGETLVVGNGYGLDYEDYATYIFHYADGVWTREAIFNHLGLAVAVDGDVALVVSSYGRQHKPLECHEDETLPECDVLRPWLYRRQEGTWVLESRMDVSLPGVQYYDIAAAVNGNTAAVSVAGQWHLFQYDGRVWTEGATLPGGSLSIDGDTLALGGAMQVTVYEYDGSTWNPRTTLNAACADAGFGGIVQLRGDTLLVSSRYAVHAFLRHDGVWSEKARLTPGEGSYAIRALALDAGTAAVTVSAEGSKLVYLFDGLNDQTRDGVFDACEFPWNLGSLTQCGAGACGAGVLGWVPMTLLGVGALKFRRVRRTRG